jgi:uncharacterized protein YceH (UPF0502 family)
MLVNLTPSQARVIGVMLEKESTTPDQYPLSLNGLTLGCNQKSNRDPVMNLSESEVQDVLLELLEKRQLTEYRGVGSRVVKYQHRFCNTEFGSLKLSRQQLAIVCVLLLRGPQTPGELRTRTSRMAQFANVEELEAVLEAMHKLNGEQLVTRMEKEPGKRECRYAHLFSDIDIQLSSPHSHTQDVADSDDAMARIEQLEQQVDELTQQLADLKEIVEILSA